MSQRWRKALLSLASAAAKNLGHAGEHPIFHHAEHATAEMFHNASDQASHAGQNSSHEGQHSSHERQNSSHAGQHSSDHAPHPDAVAQVLTKLGRTGVEAAWNLKNWGNHATSPHQSAPHKPSTPQTPSH